MTTYRNGFYMPHQGDNCAFYTTDAKPVEYHGYLVYQRVKVTWDYVKSGVCVAQRSGFDKNRPFEDMAENLAESEARASK